MERSDAYYYEKQGFIRTAVQDWQKDLFGFYPDSMGDLLYVNEQFALFENDGARLDKCEDLLEQRKRWPDEAEEFPELIARNRIQYVWAKWMHKLGKRKHMLYRWQKGMTRDPYVIHHCAATIRGETSRIARVKPPMYLWRPTFNWWRRYLITGNRFWLRAWEFAQSVNLCFKKPVFAQYLIAWQAHVVDSSKVKQALHPHVPIWNYCIRQLIHHPLRHLDEPFIMRTVPKYRFVWVMEDSEKQYKIADPNPTERYLDMASLQYVHNRNQTLFPGKQGWDMMKPLFKYRVKKYFHPFKYGFHIRIGTFELKVHAHNQRPVSDLIFSKT